MAEAFASVTDCCRASSEKIAAVAGLMPSAALPPVENEAARQRWRRPRSYLPGKVAQRLISQITGQVTVLSPLVVRSALRRYT